MSLVRFLCATSLIFFVCLKKNVTHTMEWDGMGWNGMMEMFLLRFELRIQDSKSRVLNHYTIGTFLFLFLFY